MTGKNLISTSFIEKILQDVADQLNCRYSKESFVIQFNQGKYIDGANCKIVSLKDYKVVQEK